MSRKKRKQELFHVGACMALGSYATEFIERNPYCALAWAFRRHTQCLKRGKHAAKPQTPGERHAYERGIKQGQRERNQIARRPIELLHVVNCGICKRKSGDIELIHAEINPDQYDVFYSDCDRTKLSYVNAYFDLNAPVESGDMAAVFYKRNYLLCTVKYIDNKIELYDPRDDKLFAAVQADDRFSLIGKLDHCGRDFVYPNAKETALSDETRRRGYATAADVVRGRGVVNVGE